MAVAITVVISNGINNNYICLKIIVIERSSSEYSGCFEVIMIMVLVGCSIDSVSIYILYSVKIVIILN